MRGVFVKCIQQLNCSRRRKVLSAPAQSAVSTAVDRATVLMHHRATSTDRLQVAIPLAAVHLSALVALQP